LPGKILGDQGALRFIWQDNDAAAIGNSVKDGNNFVVIYIHHDDTLGSFDLDDVAAYAHNRSKGEVAKCMMFQ
jgi:hypothetical protein